MASINQGGFKHHCVWMSSYDTHLGTRTVYSVAEELLLPCNTDRFRGFCLMEFDFSLSVR